MKFDVFQLTADWSEENGIPVWSSDVTTSTNAVAKLNKDDTSAFVQAERKLANESKPIPSLYLARRQTAGRGRSENRWENSDGALLSSWCFWMPSAPQPIFSPLVGLALFEAMRCAFPFVKFNLKAPNDLYILDKKAAGILIESTVTGTVVRSIIGIGINVFSIPSKVETSTCIYDHAHEQLTPERWQLFLKEFTARLGKATSKGLDRILDSSSRESLKEALNLHPLYTEEILEVDALGTIHMAHGKFAWSDL